MTQYIIDLERIQQMIWDDCLAHPVANIDGECGHCLGMGALTVNVSVGHPAFGKAFRCLCKRNSFTQANIRTMVEMEASMTPEDMQRYDFSDFKQWIGAHEAVEYARQIARGERPADEDGVIRPGLLLMGANGVGKTTLAAIIFKYWAARGENVVWQDYTNLIKIIQATYGEAYAGPSESEIVDRVRNASLLVLDDLGGLAQAESHSPRVSVNRIEILFQVIHYRSIKQLTTVITTNLDEAQLDAQFERRIVSRMLGMCHPVRITSTVDMRMTPPVRGGSAAR